jgi:hypothetical protein
MPKLKPNDKCSCLSGLKYKKCCYIQNYEINKYITGQSESTEMIVNIIDYLQSKFKNHRFIDITSDLNEDTYKEYQVKNYNTNTVMVAEKNKNNNLVFLTRIDNDNSNIMLMHKGGYRTFNNNDIEYIVDSLKTFIK